MANDLADELKTYLSNVPSLTPLIGVGANARVYHNRAVQAKPTPFICLEENGGEVVDLLDGASLLTQSTFSIFTYGDTRTEANQVADEIRKFLHTFAGQMGDVWVDEVFMPSYRSTIVWQPQDRSQQFFFETRQLYEFWHYLEPLEIGS